VSFGTQNPDVINTFDAFSPDRPAINASEVEASTIIPVTPIHAEALGLAWFDLTQSATSINGSKLEAYLDSGAAVWNTIVGQTVDLAKQQLCRVTWNFDGSGSVAKINCHLGWYELNVATFPTVQTDVENPGSMVVGWVYVPPGLNLRIRTLTNGGSGDTASLRVFALQFDAGLAIPDPSSILVDKLSIA